MPQRPDEVTGVLRERLAAFEDRLERNEVGTVVQAGDGIARVYGLDSCSYGELLEFESGGVGMALNLDEDDVGCVLFSQQDLVREGETVKRTGRVAEIPAGKGFIGRVVDPLGEPIDGQGPVESERLMLVERRAPSVISRKSVTVPLQTGILALDAMVPIGRGQRELIIGDRQTGKTAVAVDTIINQKGQNVICIYASIGQKASTTVQVVETLRRFGALDYTIVVAATATSSAALQYLTPYSACAMGEFFMDQGKDVLIIYDDLSKHAVAYRALSLLLRRPPGREAYPGDVFYLHSRLLERAARIAPENGGGSITALPIVETQGGDISAYIPTNVISITDGQIFLQSELFFSGVRPAIDVGLSVSRVGGAAQSKAIRKIAGRLRLDLAQYRELAVFAQFGSDLDKATQERLAHGRRLVEVLKQQQYEPMPLAQEIATLFAAINGYLADVKVEEIRSYLGRLMQHLNYKHSALLEGLQTTGELGSDAEKELREALDDFRSHTRAE
ncbi:MAG TPA: F0F1 ATP synthase subunit alpha [Rectinemataceae bacterium]|nr:F0F1 ATP synthase subunit alpha [Rectinemataceae bacterium]